MKRRFQFRLATLFVLTLVVALVACWYGSRLRAAALENHAVEQLARRGACVLLYEEGAYIQFGASPAGLCGTGLKRVVEPSAGNVSFTDRDMHLLEDIQRICSIDFQRTQASQMQIAEFKQANPKCHVTP